MPHVTDERIAELITELERNPGTVEIRDALTELQHYRTAVLRWHTAERKWDVVKWEAIGEAKHEYAIRLGDALEELHKLAWEE